MNRTPRRIGRSHGISLLEVLLAMAILASSVAVLSQLVSVGTRAAAQGRDLTQAQLLAESMLAEMAAGIVPPEPLSRVRIDWQPGWLMSTALEPTHQPGTVRLVVLVERDSDSLRAVRFQMARWIRDPSLAVPEDPVPTSSSATEDAGSGQTNPTDDSGNSPPSGMDAGGGFGGGGMGPGPGGGGRGSGGRGEGNEGPGGPGGPGRGNNGGGPRGPGRGGGQTR